MKMKRKSQIWSVDTMIAFVIFISAISFFMMFLSTTQDTSKVVKSDAELIPKALSSEEKIPLIQQNAINDTTLERITNDLDYDALKSLLGTKSDFCLFFVDKDGNLVDISKHIDNANGEIYGIGNGDIQIGQIDDGGSKTPIYCGK